MLDALLPHDPATNAVPIHGVTDQTLGVALEALPQSAARWVEVNGFRAKAGQTLMIPGEDGRPVAVLFGIHPNGDGDTAFSAGALATALPGGVYQLTSGFGDAALSALAFALSSYRFSTYRSAEPPARPRLMVSAGVDQTALSIELKGIAIARDLVNTPANALGPEELAAAAERLFSDHGGSTDIIVGDALIERGFPLVHAVGAGSDRAPRLVDCRWGDPNHTKITLVGKGVVFDTGGLDIKPSSSMALMKKDMGGAANVLGLAAMIMEAGLPVRLRVVIPAVENAISGRAFRPGDIFRSRKGLTVEIGNTDAEGRLVLADALALADEEAPDLLVDMATLTGAARVALGPDLPPYYTDNEATATALCEAAAAVHDPLWRLPLWKPYLKYLESKVADINHINTSGAGFAGSITAALFLGKFVERADAWVHFDIYAWNPADRPGRPSGGEAQGIRALYRMLREKYRP